MHHSPQHCLDITIRLQEALRHAVDHGRGRLVTYKALRQFQRDKVSGGGAGRQHVQYLFALALTGFFDLLAQDILFARLMPPVVVDERAALARPFDSPPREDLRNLCHVLLRVTTVHTKRVQFH